MPSFLHDRSANVGMIFALSLPVLGGFAGLGMDATRQMSAYNNLQRANKMACDQLQIDAALPAAARIASATAAFNGSLANFKLDPANARMTITGTGPFVIRSETTVGYFAARMVGRTNGEASHTMPCALSAPPVETPPGTPCNPVFVEGFENPRIANQWGYDFYTHLPGWVITSPDNAIEFQDVRTGGPAQEGDQYAELDTVGYNSTISKYINLNPGLFEIRFYYRPELWNTPNPNSHTMQFCFESATSPLCQNYKDHYSDVMAWREVKKALTIQRSGNYRISFRGTGLPDHDGAQIDNIRLCRL